MSNKEIEKKQEEQIKKEVSVVVKKAQGVKIGTPEDMKSAVELLSKINRKIDEITEEKERITKPLNEALKVERSRWKPIETELEEAKNILKKEMTSYQSEQLRLQKVEEDKIAARIGEGKGKFKFETAARKMGEVVVAPKNVATTAGAVKFRTVKCFEVIDVTMLPADCITANTAEIRRKMNAGIEVGGVRYYQEEQATNFR